jgi:hypothetical protein
MPGVQNRTTAAQSNREGKTEGRDGGLTKGKERVGDQISLCQTWRAAIGVPCREGNRQYVGSALPAYAPNGSEERDGGLTKGKERVGDQISL